MTRLFAFGCSFTYYKWPTWADIVGRHFDFFENWGACGVGNQFIFNSLVEATIKRDIDQNDEVMIMWTNFSRWDRYQDHQWKTSIFSRDNRDSDWRSNDALLSLMLDVRGSYVRDLALIYAAHRLLDHIGCRHRVFSMVDINNLSFGSLDTVDSEISDLLESYQRTLSKINPSVHRALFDLDWHSRPIFGSVPRRDMHPSPAEHLEYLQRVAPDIPISNETRDWIAHADSCVQAHPEIGEPIDAELNHYNIPSWNTKRIERW